MTRLGKKVKEEGVSLRVTFVLMLIVSLILTSFLLYTTYQANQSHQALSKATEDYIDLQEAANSLLNASDYLTEEAQCYTVLGERKHLENYFTEAEQTRRRENAIASMQARNPDSEAMNKLMAAMQDSLSLMNREYYAMRLILTAQGDTRVPEAIKDVNLTPEDQMLSPAAQLELGRRIMHDEEYYRQKNMIRKDLEECIQVLKDGTHNTQSTMETKMNRDLIRMTVLIILQSAGLILLLWITTHLGINPVLRAVDHIKRDQELPIVGAHEFRYLAGTYNKMYNVYKKSIENLSYKASHDELTGVYNRAGYDLIRKSLDLTSTAFLLFDADQFKQINDVNGHEIGDRVLKQIADVLKKHFRSDDYICRIGGDEFMVFMVHVTRNIRHLVERKVMQINADLAENTEALPSISLSAGVSLGREDGNPEQMFQEADTALYYVKDHGRNGCCFYNPEMIPVKREP